MSARFPRLLAWRAANRPSLRRVVRTTAWIAGSVALLVFLVVLVGAFAARSQPDLAPWHRVSLANEVDADTLAGLDWAGLLQREDALFAELEALRAADPAWNAYRRIGERRIGAAPGGIDWNRSYATPPSDAPVRGGVLLLHGLSDSPYSLRHVAAQYEAAGFVVVMPRLPGHGTVPAGLRDAQWTDWLAVAEVGARELRARIGADRPLHLVGYSNGGALALKYAMDRVDDGDDGTLPRPDRLVVMSPMIGVGRLAAFSRLMPALGFLPYFEKSRWLDVQPEFNPFKYNSFPVSAAHQSWLMTGVLQAQLLRQQASGASAELPPVLAFQSVLDSTVSTPDVVRALFDRLPANGSELVLFDINRQSLLAPMFTAGANDALASLQPRAAHDYRLTVIANAGDTDRVLERRLEPGATATTDHALPFAWPPGVYSLSHVALPFPLDDPLYGLQPRTDEDFGIRLGTLQLHGERGALSVGAEQLSRLNSNPFHAYIVARIGEGIAADSAR